MLRFNKNDELKTIFPISFQYILCYGSTFLKILIMMMIIYFNTSYVTVQPQNYDIIVGSGWNFNTSYVTVQHRLRTETQALS